PSTLVTFHATAPPVGLLDETALPWSSIATHRLLLGHDTPTRLIPMIDVGSGICTGAAQVNSEPGIGDGVGRGVGVGEATVGTGVGLGDGEDWATGRGEDQRKCENRNLHAGHNSGPEPKLWPAGRLVCSGAT